MWHPVTLLLSWAGFALCLQGISEPALLAALAILGVSLALSFAARRSRTLLWRARWLFLSLAILFLFFTPGEYVRWTPAWLGITWEGILRATEQLSRLVALLASLALLHEKIGTQGLLVGLHALLKPFPWRDATVLRLMLVLEHVEQKRPIAWREWLMPEVGGELSSQESFRLESPRLRGRDRWLLAGLAIILGAGMFRP